MINETATRLVWRLTRNIDATELFLAMHERDNAEKIFKGAVAIFDTLKESKNPLSEELLALLDMNVEAMDRIRKKMNCNNENEGVH